ncbi:MAG: DoxX family protein [Planctomycetota bacterium]
MPSSEAMRSVGLLILRVGVGGFMVTHGWAKLQMAMESGLSAFPDPLGLGAGPSLLSATAAELGGALCVVLGLLTRVSALAVAFTMGVAAFVIHGADPWTMQQGAALFSAGDAESWSSKEPALIYLVPFLALVFTGPGTISLDEKLWRRRRSAATTPPEA